MREMIMSSVKDALRDAQKDAAYCERCGEPVVYRGEVVPAKYDAYDGRPIRWAVTGTCPNHHQTTLTARYCQTGITCDRSVVEKDEDT